MNNFELILSEPHTYQQPDLKSHQLSWSSFKNNLSALFNLQLSQLEPFLNKSKDIWGQIKRNCPSLIPVMIEYYMNEVQKHIYTKLSHKVSEVLKSNPKNPIFQQLKILKEILIVHEKYVNIFDQNNHYFTIFKQFLLNTLQKNKIKEKLSKLLKENFQKYSLNKIGIQLLQFDQNLKSYLQERYYKNNKITLQLQLLQSIFDQLHAFNIHEQYFVDFYYYINQESEQLIHNYISLTDNTQFISKCLNYSRTFQKNFILAIANKNTKVFFELYVNLLDDNMFYLGAKFCCKNILDIIVDFPESFKVISSLKRCLDRANLLNEVGEYLIKQIEKRLLIPGVITQNILNQYINMLKVLQIIDPQGLIFQKITLPIKNYLLKRNDTLRCIISTLTDDSEVYSKLTLEVVKIPSKEYIQEMSSQEDQNAAKQWQILPIKESKTKKRIKYQEIDLVTVLVGLYGSQEAFITQYQNMMAQKLMSAKDYDIDEQVRNIQLLKMRFGQSALQTCNIIVKDVRDSKKNDGTIHNEKIINKSQYLSLSELNCLAVSKGYWPINYENSNKFVIPAEFNDIFTEYSSRYAKIKAMRKIIFHYNLGHVNLTLSFDNGSFDFKCSPIQAILITYFDQQKMKQYKNGVSSEDLSTELQIPQNLVRQKMSYWVHNGVIKESRLTKQLGLRRINSFEDGQVVYYKPVNVYESHIKEQIEDDGDNILTKESSSIESHLRHIIQGLILSILNTNGPKPSEKIHLLLKTVYKTDLDYTYGQAQTVQILKKMLTKKKIIYNGQLYSSKQE